MSGISFREASIRSELPVEELNRLTSSGHIKTIQNYFTILIDSDSLDTYLVNRVKPVVQQEMIVVGKKKRQELKHMVEIKHSFETITPEQAREYLATSKGNRPLSKERTAGYVRDLLTGHFHTSNDSIVFDTDGALRNGHHRLEAIVAYGLPIHDVSVMRNFPKEYVNVMDQGGKRNYQQLSFYDEENFSKQHFSISRILEFGVPGTHLGHSITYSENRDLVYKYLDAVSFVVKHSGHKKYLSTSILAVVARAYYSQSQERLLEFLDVFKTQMPTSKEDWGAQRLYTYIQTADLNGHRPKESEIYLRAESAVMHFCKRYPVVQLKAASRELFPLKLNSKGEVVAA